MRFFWLFGLLVLSACASATRPDDSARAVEGPTVSVGGSMRAHYGYARQ